MLDRHIVLDKNAHLGNLQWRIAITNGQPKVEVLFKNLCKSTIKAVKFNAIGYNEFGDIIQINGKDNFELIFQDISIAAGLTAGTVSAPLPDNSIRRILLTESQVVLDSNEILSYKGRDEISYDLKMFDPADAEESAQCAALQDIIPGAMNMPLELAGDAWVCADGCYNENAEPCRWCGHTKAENFTFTSKDYLKNLTAAHEKKVATKEAAAKQEVKQKNRKKVIIAAIAVAVIALITFNTIMSGRTLYTSSDEMQEAMQGTWVRYDESGSPIGRLVINGDSSNLYYDFSGSLSDYKFPPIQYKIKWHPHSGTFETFNKYVVKADGTLTSEGDTFMQDPYATDDSLSDTSSNTPSLKVSNVKLKSDSEYITCTGSVKNNGNSTVTFVKVKVAFKDASGDVIDTASGYAAGDEGIAPGESSTFDISVKDTSNSIQKCTASILDYD